ncbi:MAG: riboflavin kinase [Thermoprotei archaeon]|nr:MAG: riboflavin kinase [Thermoprotei archaeon]
MNEEYDVFPLVLEMAKRRCLYAPKRISRVDLMRSLGITAWRLNKLLRYAEDEGYIITRKYGRTIYYKISERGRSLLEKFLDELKVVLEEDRVIALRGKVVSGLGEGAVYMSIPEYKRSFVEILGYEPYPGTLNIRLDHESVLARDNLRNNSVGYRIEGFEIGGKKYGGLTVYKAIINSKDKAVEGAILDLDITKHGNDILEIIAPVKLREELKLKDGDEVIVEVWL